MLMLPRLLPLTLAMPLFADDDAIAAAAYAR